MDAAIVVGSVFAIACLIAVLYYAGYREGWGVGYDAAYRAMVGDLKEGKHLFRVSGLKHWEIPKHWEKSRRKEVV
jgi:hypothetical protein